MPVHQSTRCGFVSQTEFEPRPQSIEINGEICLLIMPAVIAETRAANYIDAR